MQRLFFYFLFLACATSPSFASEPMILSFNQIPLGTEFSKAPDEIKQDCGNVRQNNLFICTKDYEIGGIPMFSEFYFKENILVEIEVFFPSKDFNIVFMGLKDKYGDYAEQKEYSDYTWHAAKPSPDYPVPDEIRLQRAPNQKPMSDSSRSIVASWSSIQYWSFKNVRDEAKKRADDQANKIKDISKSL